MNKIMWLGVMIFTYGLVLQLAIIILERFRK